MVWFIQKKLRKDGFRGKIVCRYLFETNKKQKTGQQYARSGKKQQNMLHLF